MLRQYELIEKVRSYDPSADEATLNRAYVYAMRMHGTQKRASGDPYFAHPIQVAGILTEYRMDAATIITALLHDTVEDTEATSAEIGRLFGEEIAELVEGVTKLTKLELNSEHTRQAENLRKFILAISKDVRVLLVKLADRLHNMRTLQHIKAPAKRERIARETLDIYAPLARSIGVHRICTELEELAFTHLNPLARDAIIRRLAALRNEQGGAVALVSQEIVSRLEAAGVPSRVVGPRGMRIEMQIRTESMDRIAEEGVAAHWRYKDASYGFDAEHQAEQGGRDPLVNLRHLVQVLEHGGDVEELVEHAKLEMYLDQTFVFTPKGRLVSLPRGGLPLDFAYALHTDIGDTCIGVKINGEPRPLRTPLQNGDVVEVVRGPKPVVPADWRSLTVTGRARSAIRRHIRQTEKEEFTRLGRAALDQTFSRAGKSRSEVSLTPALERLAVASEDDLFERVGRGRVAPAEVLDILFPRLEASAREAAVAVRRIEGGAGARLYVRGSGLTPGVSLHFGPCCTPVPGDRIVGILEGDGQGLTVHTIDCAELAAFEEKEDLWRDLQWTPEAERDTLTQSRLTATIRNAPGVLGQACTTIGEAGGNIVNLRMHRRMTDFFDVDFDIEVKDARHLTNIAAALRANPAIETVERSKRAG